MNIHRVTHPWNGFSGRTYIYQVLPISKINELSGPGGYIFAKVFGGYWVPIYVGQTSNLSERFDHHHAMPCIRRNGATHIHVRANFGGEDARRAEESDLIARYHPPCNG